MMQYVADMLVYGVLDANAHFSALWMAYFTWITINILALLDASFRPFEDGCFSVSFLKKLAVF
jgi:hypothetical protein